jgi:FtsH-binding integral membrane protein
LATGGVRTEAHGPVLSPRMRATVLAAIAAGLLVGFAVVVVREVLATFGATTGAAGDEYQLFAVSLTGLAGGVFVVALRGASDGSGMHAHASRSDALRSGVGAAFVLAYVAAGSVATIVCLVRLGAATDLLKSLAATFLGTSVAAASSLFGITEQRDS